MKVPQRPATLSKAAEVTPKRRKSPQKLPKLLLEFCYSSLKALITFFEIKLQQEIFPNFWMQLFKFESKSRPFNYIYNWIFMKFTSIFGKSWNLKFFRFHWFIIKHRIGLLNQVKSSLLNYHQNLNYFWQLDLQIQELKKLWNLNQVLITF